MGNFSKGWITIPSQSGFYVLDYPSDWKSSEEGNVLNIFPENQTGAVTVSAFISSDKNPEELLPLVREEAQNKEIITPFYSIGKRGASGIRGVFRQIDDHSVVLWYVMGLYTKKVFVFATANFPEGINKQDRYMYEAILDSIIPNDPFM